MGLGILGDRNTQFRMKNRWLFEIKDIVGDSLPMLPPSKSARPSISIKEMEVRHLDEVVYYPGRQDWKTVNLTLYHIQCNNNPIYDWLKTIYDPRDGDDPFKYALNEDNPENSFIKREATCTLYDGCGEIMETWIYESVWPTSIEWGELDHDSSGLVFVDLTLRYARAYVEN